MKDFSLISNEILKGIHIKENPSKKEKSMNEGFLLENPSKNERNPGMKDFSLISNEILEGIHKRKILPKMREIQE